MSLHYMSVGVGLSTCLLVHMFTSSSEMTSIDARYCEERRSRVPRGAALNPFLLVSMMMMMMAATRALMTVMRPLLTVCSAMCSAIYKDDNDGDEGRLWWCGSLRVWFLLPLKVLVRRFVEADLEETGECNTQDCVANAWGKAAILQSSRKCSGSIVIYRPRGPYKPPNRREIDCTWSTWSSWRSCSTSCGMGEELPRGGSALV